MMPPFQKEKQEISDAIVAFDPETLERQPVRKSEIVETFQQCGDQWAARIVQALPAVEDVLDPNAVDRLLIAVHCEMQRISEEFQHGPRVAQLLRPLLDILRPTCPPPLRVVDIGCGTGYVVRWLAAKGALGGDVELMGVDYNAALISEAQRLADSENLPCEFAVANAFRLAAPATVYLSTGILHHFRGAGLMELFRQHEKPATQAFLHFDFQPSPIAGLGSWLFHAVRVRQPLAKHDGVVSALRVHDGPTLLAAAQAGAPDFAVRIHNARLWGLPIPRAFHCVVGLRPRHRQALDAVLGREKIS